MIYQYRKGSSERVGFYFKASEFDCPCGHCKITLIDSELSDKLNSLRRFLDQPITITSGYRCDAYQKHLEENGYETAKNSMHLLGCAADLKCGNMTGEELETAAFKCGFQAIGRGKFFCHVDLREKFLRWEYKT